MESPLPAILDAWLMQPETIDWESPRSRCLASIHDLRYTEACPELVQAAMVYWDPTMHVFRFYQDEMCPTVEEFQAYLRAEELSASVIQGEELNIAHLIELYGLEGALGDYVEQAHRCLVLLLCALAASMLILVNERVCPSLVSIALQMNSRKNIMPIVLAETLMGLDLVKSGQADSFSGCPLLLQIVSGFLLVFKLVQLCLSDEVGVLEAPQASFEHFPRYLVERLMSYPELLMVEWYTFLNDMQSEDIVWRCSWLNRQEMTVNSVGFERVVIAGLTSFTFYIPECILLQLGISQGNKRFGKEHFELPAFNACNLHIYRCSWNNRDLDELLLDSITWLKSRYVNWLHKKVKARSGDTTEAPGIAPLALRISSRVVRPSEHFFCLCYLL
ncbi:hypothetical protein RHMOL_Rhmol10G0171800 [Rhododendron molle]|uniref:Uncharacterized protein n=1 Tax=Rhododendron molle TaxID=49168 RepID=A0ACC0M3D0_RHOML|nr:hypothetical protein RHMOL_Rhmol10G0171800 [Rhododendron molle]